MLKLEPTEVHSSARLGQANRVFPGLYPKSNSKTRIRDVSCREMVQIWSKKRPQPYTLIQQYRLGQSLKHVKPRLEKTSKIPKSNSNASSPCPLTKSPVPHVRVSWEHKLCQFPNGPTKSGNCPGLTLCIC